MDRDDNIICEETLQYFGAMLPSLSHEAKNALAIINENAGLMDDYILMAQKGKTLDLKRLGSLSATIRKQVVRLNALIMDVRQAADGIDNRMQDICLVHHTRQVAELLSKKAATRSIRFDVCATEEPILVHTRPVLLLHFLWICLDFAMQACEQGRQIELRVEKRTHNALVLISGIDEMTPASLTAIMPDERRHTVLSALNAELTLGEKNRAMLLQIRKHHV